MGENNQLETDFVHLARLAVNEQWDDVRLLVARLLRAYRKNRPDLAKQLDEFLKLNPARRGGPLRDVRFAGGEILPTEEENSKPTPLKAYDGITVLEAPLLTPSTSASINQLILERQHTASLKDAGLTPTRSAIFEGPPGVGKTLTARWIAHELGKPLLVLDLTAVMSSFLGRTGINLRNAIEYAKHTDAVLLLDEIDAIAKRRSDDADIGELKRLVTVVLQEVDAWPETSLLLAATNHPELLDPALWRRFDVIINFDLPSTESIKASLKRFLGVSYKQFSHWLNALSLVMTGESFSDIEKTIQRFRRSVALGISSPNELAEAFIIEKTKSVKKNDRVKLAAELAKNTKLSQHKISQLTGVARDTIRKYTDGVIEGSI
jgi:SpoVK/Ycf46/Vps4 family AAA+-type ATPase